MGCTSSSPSETTPHSSPLTRFTFSFTQLQLLSDDVKPSRYSLLCGTTVDAHTTRDIVLANYEKFEGTSMMQIKTNMETYENTKTPAWTLWIPVPVGTAGARKATDFKWWFIVQEKLISSGASGSPTLLKELTDRPLVAWTDEKTLGDVVSLQRGSSDWQASESVDLMVFMEQCSDSRSLHGETYAELAGMVPEATVTVLPGSDTAI